MTNNIDISKILSLSDEELKAKITLAAAAAGGDSRKIQSAMQDTEKLRRVIGSLTQKDIQNLINTVGKEKAEQIAKLINNQ